MKTDKLTDIRNQKQQRFLKIAGYVLRLITLYPENETEREDFLKMTDSHFGGFLIKKPGNSIIPDFNVLINHTANNIFLNKSKHAFIKLYDQAGASGEITTFYSISVFQFQLILLQVLNKLLGEKGMVIHCSAVNIRNKTVLFLGKSGAGKSTAAELLSGKHEILADDDGIIKKENGAYYFYQSPSIEKTKTITKSESGYPIKAIFILKKSGIYKSEKITDKEIIFKKLTQQLLGDLNNPRLKIKFLFKMADKFNKFYYLFFGKDKKAFGRLINNEQF